MSELNAMPQRRMTAARIQQAAETLKKYKSGKAHFEKRLKADEKWWKGHAWDTMQEQGNPKDPKHPTKWLVNVIMGKHADMVDSYPEPVILAREQSDEAEAKKLTSILPVILEQNHFEDVFSAQAWEKNKHGTAAYAVYWDSGKLNGLGDISICGIDLMNLFWEPGIEDIQESENVFLVSAQNKEALKQMYPQLEDKNLGGELSLTQYETEDTQDRESKALVVDWYYHTYEGRQKVLQYCKFCGLEVLYASEDDPALQGRGWYEDGEYPFVLDRLFPQKGSPVGWGYIDLGRDAQESIDLLDYAITLNAKAGAIPRYFRRKDSAINLDNYMDFTNPIVEVEGGLGDTDMVPVQHKSLDGIYITHLNNKIEELKQTCGNQDVTNGMTTGGVTAASGIAAQMEAAGRTSRDGNKGTYRAYSKILELVIERIRQFYDIPRTFRILGESAAVEYAQMDNSGLMMQPNEAMDGLEMGWRKPVFDIQVSAQKQNAYSKMAQNELALQLLNAGVFNPGNADQSLLLLHAMDFAKKDEIIQKVSELQTIHQELAQWQQMALELAQRYEPDTAERMAETIMQSAQTAAPAAVGRVSLGGRGTGGMMERAREQSRNVASPD